MASLCIALLITESREASRPSPLEMMTLASLRVTLILGVDRLDYTKGIRQRLEAFERLLQRHARCRGHVRFVQWAAPSRATVPEYRAEREAIEELAGRINRTFGAPPPV